MPAVPNELVEAINAGQAAAFVGAGFSIRSGYPSWYDLLNDLLTRAVNSNWMQPPKADELRAHLNDPNDYLMVAQEMDDILTPGRFRDEISRVFEDYKPPAPAHEKLVSLPFSLMVTTNYDRLLENAYASKTGRIPPLYTYEKPGGFIDKFFRNEFFVLKAHGKVDDPHAIVLTERDYRNVIYRAPGYRSALETLFNSKCILFLGASMRDPELRLLLSFLHDAFGCKRRPKSVAPVGAKA